jgi:ATP-binding cassette subfamily A (ABC1) protein 3
MPREFGKAEPWNFICKRKQTLVSDLKIGDEQHDPRLVKLGNFEKEFLNQNESLKIRGLRKQFVNKTVAVDNESMTMNKG